MKKLLILFFTCCSLSLIAQPSPKPKLVVGVVVDQMRQEYLYRYESKFSTNGFRRLMNDGFVLKNAHYNYTPTSTGPGHASIYTGTTPAVHGIMGNDFYDKKLKKKINCVEDNSQKLIGVETGERNVSPWRLLSTTITDEMKIFSQKKSKVIGVSMKDRGAVLPAGHMPDGAYWMDKETGKMITSTWYKKELPAWVTKFNDQKIPDKFLEQTWNLKLPVSEYTESMTDNNPYEIKVKGKTSPTFPYNLKTLGAENGKYLLFEQTPFGNDFIFQFTKAAIEAEELGKDESPDFLAVSFSSTDLLAHEVGPQAVETEDMYLKLDETLSLFLKMLDEKVGKENYTLFLTSDHGVAENPQYLRDNKITAGYFSHNKLKADLNEYLSKFFNSTELVEHVSNFQVFFNQDLFTGNLQSAGIDMMIAYELTVKFLLNYEGVANAFPQTVLRNGDYGEKGYKGMLIRGFHPKRSGDVVFYLEPGWIHRGLIQGTDHGSPYSYDTHVPVIFYGNGIKKGSSTEFHTITDIAPTISTLLKIKFPSGCTGQPIKELFN
ncbi:MAG: alkaline phosphatase family protein [Flammeovirgaceae bacterium]|nr:alkaline phosphatase family protein [Flammeovirgaceae bacterium]